MAVLFRKKGPTLFESGGGTVLPPSSRSSSAWSSASLSRSRPPWIGQERWPFLIGSGSSPRSSWRRTPPKRACPRSTSCRASCCSRSSVYPIGVTAKTSFTNYGDGTRSTKEEAVSQIIGSSVVQTPDAPRYNLTVGTTVQDQRAVLFFLVDPDGNALAGTPDATGVSSTRRGHDRELSCVRRTVHDPDRAGAQRRRRGAGRLFAVPTEDADSGSSASPRFEGETTLEYDEAADTITDVQNRHGLHPPAAGRPGVLRGRGRQPGVGPVPGERGSSTTRSCSPTAGSGQTSCASSCGRWSSRRSRSSRPSSWGWPRPRR